MGQLNIASACERISAHPCLFLMLLPLCCLSSTPICSPLCLYSSLEDKTPSLSIGTCSSSVICLLIWLLSTGRSPSGKTCSVHHVDGPPAHLSQDFRVHMHLCIWSGAPEPVLCASRLPFLASFVSPALRFPPTCHVHLLPPPVTHTMSPQHLDEASVPSLSPNHVPSLIFTQASAHIQHMSSLPAGFPLECR